MKKILIILLIVVLLAAGWSGILKPSQPVSDHSEDAAKYMAIAKEQLALNAFGSAIDYASAAVRASDTMEAEKLLAECYDKAGYTSEYRDCMEKMIQFWPDDLYAYEQLSSLYLERSNYSACADVCLKAYQAGCATDELMDRYYDARYHYSFVSEAMESAGSFRNGMAVVELQAGEYYYVDTSLRSLLGPMEYASAPLGSILGFSADGEMVFYRSDGVKYMDSEEHYDTVYSMSESRALVQKNGEYYFVDSSCKPVLGSFEDASCFLNGVAAVRSSGQWNLIRTNGEIVASGFQQVKLDEDRTCSGSGMVFMDSGSGYDLYNTAGEKVLSAGFADVRPFDNGNAAAVCNGQKWGFVDRNGNMLLDFQYEDARSFSDGLAAVCIDGKWGFITESGRLVIDAIFEDAGSMRGNLAPVRTEDGWYYISVK